MFPPMGPSLGVAPGTLLVAIAQRGAAGRLGRSPAGETGVRADLQRGCHRRVPCQRGRRRWAVRGRIDPPAHHRRSTDVGRRGRRLSSIRRPTTTAWSSWPPTAGPTATRCGTGTCRPTPTPRWRPAALLTVRATFVDGEDHTRLFDHHAELMPNFRDYVARAGRGRRWSCSTGRCRRGRRARRAGHVLTRQGVGEAGITSRPESTVPNRSPPACQSRRAASTSSWLRATKFHHMTIGSGNGTPPSSSTRASPAARRASSARPGAR